MICVARGIWIVLLSFHLLSRLSSSILDADVLFTVQLLHKLQIRGVNGSEKLLKVIKVRVPTHSYCSYPHVPCNRTQSPTTSPRTPTNSVSLPPLPSTPSILIKLPALSGDAKTTRLSRYLPTIPQTHNIAVFVGAMARGRDDFADHIVDEKISISDYPLSASVACGKVRNGFPSLCCRG